MRIAPCRDNRTQGPAVGEGMPVFWDLESAKSSSTCERHRAVIRRSVVHGAGCRKPRRHIGMAVYAAHTALTLTGWIAASANQLLGLLIGARGSGQWALSINPALDVSVARNFRDDRRRTDNLEQRVGLRAHRELDRWELGGELVLPYLTGTKGVDVALQSAIKSCTCSSRHSHPGRTGGSDGERQGRLEW